MKTKRPSRKAYLAAQKEYNAALERFRHNPDIAEIYDQYSERSKLAHDRFDEEQSEINKALEAINVLLRFQSILSANNSKEFKRDIDFNGKLFRRSMDSDRASAIRNTLVIPYEEEMLRLRNELLAAGWTEKEL